MEERDGGHVAGGVAGRHVQRRLALAVHQAVRAVHSAALPRAATLGGPVAAAFAILVVSEVRRSDYITISYIVPWPWVSYSYRQKSLEVLEGLHYLINLIC